MNRERIFVEPLGDRVVVYPDPPDDVSEGGIIIPDLAKHRPQMGTVVAVGPGRWVPEMQDYKPLGLEAGDRILFSKYGGTDIELNIDESVTIINEADIMGIVRTVEVDMSPGAVGVDEPAAETA